MKIQIRNQKDEVMQIICNGCGRRLPVSGTGIALEDYLHVEKEWGYFSEQDGQKVTFDLCEACTDRLLRNFKVPAYQQTVTEIMI